MACTASLLAASALPTVMLPPAFANESGSKRDAIRQALNRLTFGATDKSTSACATLGFEAWLEQQLDLRADDEATETQLRRAYLPISYDAGKDEKGQRWKALDEPGRRLTRLNSKSTELVVLNDWERGMDYSERERPAREVQLATLIRAVHSEAQVFEVIVQFWHDHFNVNSVKDAGCAAYFPLYDKAIRAEALGNFRKLLGSIVRSPSMLFYLNNEASRASPANENFARELLEQHTLGEINYLNDQDKDWKDVPGASEGRAAGYIDQDVFETARAFTGWTVSDGREMSEGEKLPMTGEFAYVDGWHDPYQKRILGREFRPNSSPMEDGEAVLDMLARHPGTARFIATKLIRRLLKDEPPETLVTAVTKKFLEHIEDPNQIASIVRLIATSDAFNDEPPLKVKRPFEFLASLYRSTGAKVETMGNAASMLSRAGYKLHEWRPPTGHPDVASYWSNTNTLAVMVAIATNGLEDWFGCGKVELFAGERKSIRTIGELCEVWSRALLGRTPDDAFLQALAGGLGAPDDPLADDESGRTWQARTVIALVALSPEFMTR